MNEVMRVDEIRVERRHRKDLGDVAALASSIQSLGLLHPPVVTSDGRLVAGERRLAAIRQLGWAEVEVRTVATLDDALAILRAERDENTCRKDFTPSEAVAIGAALEELERQAARARQAEAGPKKGRGKKATGSGNFPEPVRGQTRDRVGEAVGMSGKTYEKAKAVVQAAEAEPEKYGKLVEQMDRTGRVDGTFAQLKAIRNAEMITEGNPAFKPPVTGGRTVRVARNANERRWRIFIGPNRNGVELSARLERKRQGPEYREAQEAIDTVHSRVTDLRAQADELRRQADELEKQAREEAARLRARVLQAVEQEHGPAVPYTETVEFVVEDEELERRLETLSTEDLVDYLMQHCDGQTIRNTERGYWGDMALILMSPNKLETVEDGFTRTGSPDAMGWPGDEVAEE